MPAAAPTAPFARLAGHHGPVMRLVLDEVRGLGISADTKGMLRGWHLRAGTAPTPAWQTSEPGAIYALVPATIGKTDVVIAAGAYSRLSVYARDTGQPRTHLVLTKVQGTVRDLAYVANRGWLYAVTQTGMLAAFELASGRRLLAEDTELVSGYSLTARAEAPPNTAVVAVGSHDGWITFFQHSPTGLVRFRKHAVGEAVVYDATFFGPPGTNHTPGLLAAGSDGTILRQGELDPAPVPLGRDKGEVYALAVTPVGRRVLSGGEAAQITVRDVPDGQVVARLQTDGAAIWSLAIAADGRLAAAGDASGTLLLYDLDAALTAG